MLWNRITNNCNTLSVKTLSTQIFVGPTFRRPKIFVGPNFRHLEISSIRADEYFGPTKFGPKFDFIKTSGVHTNFHFLPWKIRLTLFFSYKLVLLKKWWHSLTAFFWFFVPQRLYLWYYHIPISWPWDQGWSRPVYLCSFLVMVRGWWWSAAYFLKISPRPRPELFKIDFTPLTNPHKGMSEWERKERVRPEANILNDFFRKANKGERGQNGLNWANVLFINSPVIIMK